MSTENSNNPHALDGGFENMTSSHYMNLNNAEDVSLDMSFFEMKEKKEALPAIDYDESQTKQYITHLQNTPSLTRHDDSLTNTNSVQYQAQNLNELSQESLELGLNLVGVDKERYQDARDEYQQDKTQNLQFIAKTSYSFNRENVEAFLNHARPKLSPYKAPFLTVSIQYLFNTEGDWVAFIVDNQLYDTEGEWIGWFPWHDSQAVGNKGRYLATVEGNRIFELKTIPNRVYRSILPYQPNYGRIPCPDFVGKTRLPLYAKEIHLKAVHL